MTIIGEHWRFAGKLLFEDETEIRIISLELPHRARNVLSLSKWMQLVAQSKHIYLAKIIEADSKKSIRTMQLISISIYKSGGAIIVYICID